VVRVAYSNGVKSLILWDNGNALSLRFLDVIKLIIKQKNNDLCTVGMLQN